MAPRGMKFGIFSAGRELIVSREIMIAAAERSRPSCWSWPPLSVRPPPAGVAPASWPWRGTRP